MCINAFILSLKVTCPLRLQDLKKAFNIQRDFSDMIGNLRYVSYISPPLFSARGVLSWFNFKHRNLKVSV